MGLSASAIVDLVELIYFIPAFLLAIYVTYKHGFGKKLGWVFLMIFSVARIGGTATGIAASFNPSQGLIQASYILLTFGVSFLLFSLLGLLARVGQCMEGRGCPPKVAAFANIPILIGLILSLVGSTDMFKNSQSSRDTGYTYLKAGSMLYLVAYGATVVVTLYDLFNIRHVRKGEKRVLFAVAACLPFLLTRIIYSILGSFIENSTVFSAFSDTTAAIIVHAVMVVTPESTIVTILLVAGLLADANPREMQTKSPAPEFEQRNVYPSHYTTSA